MLLGRGEVGIGEAGWARACRDKTCSLLAKTEVDLTCGKVRAEEDECCVRSGRKRKRGGGEMILRTGQATPESNETVGRESKA